jgi:hypothetical protein
MLPSTAKHLLERFVRIGRSRDKPAPPAAKKGPALPKPGRGSFRQLRP